VRYLTLDLNPEGSGQHRLIPINMCRIKANSVVVRSLFAHNFAGVPVTKKADEVTLLEEDKIMGYYAGGTLYASAARLGPKI
jgi:photosynthetic reaction center H subunit